MRGYVPILLPSWCLHKLCSRGCRRPRNTNTKYPSNLGGRVAHGKLASGRRLDSVSRSRIYLPACRRKSSFSQCFEPSRPPAGCVALLDRTGRQDKVQGGQRETRAESDVANMSQHDGCEGSSISILVVMVVDGCEAFVLARARACPWRAELCKRVHNLLGFGSSNQESFLSVK
jgi:hypothetical protein